MIHYETTDQITKKTKYQFRLPKFGKSTTDPTYYEPSATRIANMRKSAHSGVALYDFDGDEKTDWSKIDIDSTRIVPGRKPGLTQEEISQNYNDVLNDTQSAFKEQENKVKENKEQIELAKKASEAIEKNGSSEKASDK